MLTHKTNTILFLSLCLISVVLWFSLSQVLFLYLLIVWFFLFQLGILWGAFNIQSGYFIESINSIPTKENKVFLSFDDGPHPIYTPMVLDLLKEKNIKGLFFIIGKNIPGNEALLKRIADEGHSIGNHSFSHANFFDFYGTQKVLEELKSTDELIENCIGKSTELFRPPYGVTNPNIAKAVKKRNKKVIGWNIRTFDTVEKRTEKILSKINATIQPGSILLFHDTSQSSVQSLRESIALIEKLNYTCDDIKKHL